MKRFILGDIHGKKDYLEDVLEQSKFDFENDLLIQIGDIVDRGPDPFGCVDILRRVQNLQLIRGNHDEAFLSRITTGQSYLGDHPENGQQITLELWDELKRERKQEILKFFDRQADYHITKDNIMFVHGGIPPDEDLEQVSSHVFHWDREMLSEAIKAKEQGLKLEVQGKYKAIFIGHTPTLYYGMITPMYIGNIINIDTGSGKGGPLTIMDIDSGQYWQSKHSLKIVDNGINQESEETEAEEGEEGSGESNSES